MRRSQKSKRVCWASDGNLCQVRLFLSEESPSQVGLGAQDHLQAKASWMLHSNGTNSDENLPPGFERTTPASQLQNKLSQIPLSKWRCPPKFTFSMTWQVVAGEESKEVEDQNRREMRVLEAVYPRESAIPPNPSFVPDINGVYADDQNTPLIPITPIEEEDGIVDYIPTSMQPPMLAPGITAGSQCNAINILNPPLVNERPATGVALGIEPSVLSAASAAATEMLRGNEQGTMIDQDLLIKILSNPKLVEKLVAEHGMGTNSPAVSNPVVSLSPQATLPNPPPHIDRSETATAPLGVTVNGSFYTPPNGMVGHASNFRPAPPRFPVPPVPSVGAPVVKDLNYYKSLIQRHGGDGQDGASQGSQESIYNRARDNKPRINKPCIYFNSSRGCRNGANCVYQHDTSLQQGAGGGMQEVRSAKRMKMDREITGTQSCS